MPFVYLLLSFIISVVSTLVLRRIFLHFKIVDTPTPGKIHSVAMPLGGGLAIFLGFFAVVFFALGRGDVGYLVPSGHLFGLLAGGILLMLGGFLDDKYQLKARYQLWFPILAALILAIIDIAPSIVTNPFGGVINIGNITIGGVFGGVLLANLITFVWLNGVMFTTKLLDGLDGLVAGIVAIGAGIIYLLTTIVNFNQPEAGILALIFLGAVLGFLVFNYNPAKIFLGQGGSLFTGYILGFLAIVSGGKIFTTLLILIIPILDIIRVVYRRLKNNVPFWRGDKEHLHFKLLATGLSQRGTVLIYYFLSLSIGLFTLAMQKQWYLPAGISALVFIMLIAFIVWRTKKIKV